ncbi:MAG: pilus assembly protein [Patescibacteria group bacterium]|nr:pilus assembly protein [Patescibacteria group bacterium]
MVRCRKQQGWASIEFLITFPAVFAVFLMIVFFGLLVKSKLTLQNATHAGVQVLAKTNNCNLAIDYVKANFEHDAVSVSCTPGSAIGEKTTLTARYTYAGTSLIGIVIPDTLLISTAVAIRMK